MITISKLRLFKNKIGVTLTEVLVAVGIFATVSVISASILVSIVQLEKKTSLQNAVYEDLRMILQQITYEIQHGTIDYEEYYNQYVIYQQNAPFNFAAPKNSYYGVNYGVYGSRFYDPGKSLVNKPKIQNPIDLGSECSFPEDLAAGRECEITYTLSNDLNTGKSPFTGVNSSTVNAFRDCGTGGCQPPDPAFANKIDQLFLLDETGMKKTIIALKKVTGSDYALGIVKMDGFDKDQNGVIDTFSCSPEFKCYGGDNGVESNVVKTLIKAPLAVKAEDSDKIKRTITLPKSSDLAVPFKNMDGSLYKNVAFIPISPLRLNITNLRFVISPLDDPYKAYAEKDMQTHPSVTIFITIDLAQDAKADYPGTFDPITVQTTVAAGVVGYISSYPPVNQIRAKGKSNWIDSVLPDILNTP